MNRILLADDSPHAQRMGERILREEGYEVVSVTDGETALLRLGDVDPDVIIADVFLPGRSGVEMCRHVKGHPGHQHVRMVLTAGLLETFDEAEAKAAGADAIIKKPFEASVVLETIKPLAQAAQAARNPGDAGESEAVKPSEALPSEPAKPERLNEDERIRAAVTLALDAVFPSLVEQITRQVLTIRAAPSPNEN